MAAVGASAKPVVHGEADGADATGADERIEDRGKPDVDRRRVLGVRHVDPPAAGCRHARAAVGKDPAITGQRTADGAGPTAPSRLEVQ